MSTLNLDVLNKQPSLPDTESKLEAAKLEEDKKNSTSNEDGMVLLDGPLSSIFTDALNKLYGNNGTNVSKESQQLDSAIEAGIIKDFNTTTPEDSDKYINSTYCYVTNGNSLDDESTEAFNVISNLVENNRFKKVMVCIEGKACSKGSVLLEQYLEQANVPIYRNRGSMLDQISLESYDKVSKPKPIIGTCKVSVTDNNLKANISFTRSLKLDAKQSTEMISDIEASLKKIINKYNK